MKNAGGPMEPNNNKPATKAKRYSRISPSSELEEEVLCWANEVRATLQRKPVKTLAKGIPGEEQQCVLARTIGSARISKGTVVLQLANAARTLPTPEFIDTFITEFDRGAFHHLEDNIDNDPALD